jgi:hypothetical protein
MRRLPETVYSGYNKHQYQKAKKEADKNAPYFDKKLYKQQEDWQFHYDGILYHNLLQSVICTILEELNGIRCTPAEIADVQPDITMWPSKDTIQTRYYKDEPNYRKLLEEVKRADKKLPHDYYIAATKTNGRPIIRIRGWCTHAELVQCPKAYNNNGVLNYNMPLVELHDLSKLIPKYSGKPFEYPKRPKRIISAKPSKRGVTKRII